MHSSVEICHFNLTGSSVVFYFRCELSIKTVIACYCHKQNGYYFKITFIWRENVQKRDCFKTSLFILKSILLTPPYLMQYPLKFSQLDINAFQICIFKFTFYCKVSVESIWYYCVGVFFCLFVCFYSVSQQFNTNMKETYLECFYRTGLG